jgi:acyl-CoA synthetase (AMP-forming)/AMP-acid ligase II
MPLPLMRRCLEAFDRDFYQVYGCTEASGVFCVLGPDDHRDAAHPERLGSAGRPIAGVELRVVDPDTRTDVPTGTTGEFWIRSEQTTSGYWNRPEETTKAYHDGWYRTGDAGFADEDGFLFISDRVKDMIVSGGENIYPAEVERVIVDHPAVAEVCVIGVPDPVYGEAVKAVVVAREGTSVDQDDIIAFTRERLARYKAPKSVDVVDALPRNATGKVLKRELREPYWAGRDRAV